MKKALLIILVFFVFKTVAVAQNTINIQGSLIEIKKRATSVGVTFDILTLENNLQQLKNINPTYLPYLDFSFKEEKENDNKVKLSALVIYKKPAEESVKILFRYFLSNNISSIKVENKAYKTEDFFNDHLLK